jgi:hypothetical protein
MLLLMRDVYSSVNYYSLLSKPAAQQPTGAGQQLRLSNAFRGGGKREEVGYKYYYYSLAAFSYNGLVVDRIPVLAQYSAE